MSFQLEFPPSGAPANLSADTLSVGSRCHLQAGRRTLFHSQSKYHDRFFFTKKLFFSRGGGVELKREAGTLRSAFLHTFPSVYSVFFVFRLFLSSSLSLLRIASRCVVTDGRNRSFSACLSVCVDFSYSFSHLPFLRFQLLWAFGDEWQEFAFLFLFISPFYALSLFYHPPSFLPLSGQRWGQVVGITLLRLSVR